MEKDIEYVAVNTPVVLINLKDYTDEMKDDVEVVKKMLHEMIDKAFEGADKTEVRGVEYRKQIPMPGESGKMSQMLGAKQVFTIRCGVTDEDKSHVFREV